MSHTGGLLRRASMVVQLEAYGLEARFWPTSGVPTIHELGHQFRTNHDCRLAKGLALPPSTLLLLEREEDPRDIRKRVDSLLTKCNPQQLEMVHRIIKVLLEP